MGSTQETVIYGPGQRCPCLHVLHKVVHSCYSVRSADIRDNISILLTQGTRLSSRADDSQRYESENHMGTSEKSRFVVSFRLVTRLPVATNYKDLCSYECASLKRHSYQCSKGFVHLHSTIVADVCSAIRAELPRQLLPSAATLEC